ncbi:MAG: Adenine-specific methyltransferase [Gemmatimonadetes bacterium]|nr:Adenine-specific methyltransferase [Gemmatimonadota bacterium]
MSASGEIALCATSPVAIPEDTKPTARVIVGDCLTVMPTLEANSSDAVICDPPYGLGFMGKVWDHGVPGAPFWAEALRVATPGAYLLAFGGTRTYHRLTCAIEDAGWQIHDSISWLYGSGFPKHKSKLKPGWEPIVVAWKKAPKASPLNIDACRLETTDSLSGSGMPPYAFGGQNARPFHATAVARATSRADGGRWPANVVLDEDAAAELDEQSGVLTSGRWNGQRNTPKTDGIYGAFAHGMQSERGATGDSGGASRFFYCAKASRSERDEGLTGERRAINWSSGTQNPGSFQSEGTDKTAVNFHPCVKPLSLMRWLCRLVTPRGGADPRSIHRIGFNRVRGDA